MVVVIDADERRVEVLVVEAVRGDDRRDGDALLVVAHTHGEAVGSRLDAVYGRLSECGRQVLVVVGVALCWLVNARLLLLLARLVKDILN